MTLDKQLIRTNIWASVALSVFFLIGLRSNHIAITALGTLIASIHMLFLSGANIIYLLQKLQKRILNTPLFITLSILASLFFIPAILLGIYSIVGYINQWMPLFFYLGITTIPSIWRKLMRQFPQIEDTPIPKISFSFSLREIALHPITISVFLISATHIYNITRYPFLAVLDPYSWLIKFEQVISSGNLHAIDDGDRTLYTVLITTFHYLSSASFYAITKYLFPFLSLLAIPPLYLAVKNLSRVFQYAFLMAALASPVVIFEFEIVRQQLLALIYMYYVVGLCAAYAATKDKLAIHAIGASAVIGSLYHPLFFMIIIPWGICMIFLYGKTVWRHKIQGLILLLLLIPWIEKIGLDKIIGSVSFLGKKLVLRFIQGNHNWEFPAHYVNIDQNPVGWAGASGVMRYYAFYAGALSLTIILAYIGSSIVSSTFRSFLRKQLRTIAVIIPLLLIIFFFIVAEIAPRTSNIAYLPDRAWQILSIVLLFPLLGMLHFIDRSHFVSSYPRRSMSIVLAAAIAVNIFGAGYVSYLGKFTTPEYEQRAGEWIMQNLPKDRIIFSASSKNLLRFHTQSNRIHLDPEYFATADSSLIAEHLVTLLKLKGASDKPLNALNIAEKTTEGIEESTKENTTSTDTSYDNISICEPGYISYIHQKIAIQCSVPTPAMPQGNTIAAPEKLKIPKEYSSAPLYLYYAHTHPRNPYISRPYKSSFTGNRQESQFPGIDSNPDVFEKIYSDDKNIFIWQVHLEKTEIPIE